MDAYAGKSSETNYLDPEKGQTAQKYLHHCISVIKNHIFLLYAGVG